MRRAALLGGGASPIATPFGGGAIPIATLFGGGASPTADTEIKKEADPCGSAPCVSIKLNEDFFDQH